MNLINKLYKALFHKGANRKISQSLEYMARRGN